MRRWAWVGVWWLAAAGGLAAQQMALHTGWTVQSSARVTAAPEAIARAGFDTTGWYAAAVPSTVFNALVEDKVVPDPDYGMNLRQAAGVEYPIGANYSHTEMPETSPYRVPWWFRTEFTLPAGFRGKTVWLDFHGINYRANIWLNGHRIASDEEAQGTFRRFEFDVSGAVASSGPNALAVEVFAPRIHDLAITFVDWNPMPPDKDMGLWGGVELRASGAVALRNVFVSTQLAQPGLESAALTVSADLINAGDRSLTGSLRGAVAGHRLGQTVTLGPHERRTVSFPAFTVTHPQLWWPRQLGTPHLENLSLRFVTGGAVSDTAEQAFGISQITTRRTAQGAIGFVVNGKPLQIRGGGWTPDMLLRDGPSRWAEDFAYVCGMNLNAVRLEGKLMDDAFFDLADREGILVMAGWCCCDHWEEWASWTGDEKMVATASLADQARRLRTHPSLLVWLNGSDNPPPPAIEQAYLEVLREADWPKPILSSASGKKTTVTGESGVKMTGPYDYVPPNYWLAEPQLGGASGFNTETSPGAAIPPVESLRRFLPSAHLWPADANPAQGLDAFWNFHAGSGQFLNLNRFNTALAARYGAARSLNDYVWKAQAMAYEGERAMFESFGRNQDNPDHQATGVIQWMLNNGWPSLIWHLYDYYLRPGAGYFAVKLANEPLHVQYSDFDRRVCVVNREASGTARGLVTASVYGLNGKARGSQNAPVTVSAGATQCLMSVPEQAANTFLELEWRGPDHALVSSNFYWLSTRPDQLDEKAGTWFFMPETSTADFSALEALPPATLTERARFSQSGDTGMASVTLTNSGPAVAFFVRLRVTQGAGGDEVLPVLWNDNYISLLPGETRTLRATYRLEDLAGAAPALAVDGWNVRGTDQGSLEMPPAERASAAGNRSHDSQRPAGATRVRSGVSTQ